MLSILISVFLLFFWCFWVRLMLCKLLVSSVLVVVIWVWIVVMVSIWLMICFVIERCVVLVWCCCVLVIVVFCLTCCWMLLNRLRL